MAAAKPMRLKLTRKSSLKAEDLSKTILAIQSVIPRLDEFTAIVGGSGQGEGATRCGTHTCDGYEPEPPGGGDCSGHSACDTEACSTQTCSSHDCDTNGCSAHACSDANFGCDQHTGGVISPDTTAGRQVAQLQAALGAIPGGWSGISLTIN